MISCSNSINPILLRNKYLYLSHLVDFCPITIKRLTVFPRQKSCIACRLLIADLTNILKSIGKSKFLEYPIVYVCT